ncbi:MAG: ACP S-malonyltransferase [Candidatus Neomarinimicrobiota bacterium]
MPREKIIVICPGRGSYSRETSGYLKKYLDLSLPEINFIVGKRKFNNQLSPLELDSLPFRAKVHMVGENASALIYACSFMDFTSIDREKYEIVAIAGNSMGWYTALALSGAVLNENAFELIDTMGSMMKDKIIGGQLIYPIIDRTWQADHEKTLLVLDAINKANAYVSIYLGGYIVIGGDNKSLTHLKKILPPIDDYPFKIPYHGAFHTPLMNTISTNAFGIFPSSFFSKPNIPLIDGRGNIWESYSTNPQDLYNYTLGTQVTKAYDFTKSITVAMKEFCPDKIVLLGPGNSLGGAVGQIIVQNNWNNVNSKKTFLSNQNQDPFLVSMGIAEQREIVSI